MVGEEMELVARHRHADEMEPYERLLGDAMRGDQSLFAREDSVEAAWRVVDLVLGKGTLLLYEPGTWGPPKAAKVIIGGEAWHNPRRPGRERD
jgi:glucose-6-phosphate 1-dehydrogenase